MPFEIDRRGLLRAVENVAVTIPKDNFPGRAVEQEHSQAGGIICRRLDAEHFIHRTIGNSRAIVESVDIWWPVEDATADFSVDHQRCAATGNPTAVDRFGRNYSRGKHHEQANQFEHTTPFP